MDFMFKTAEVHKYTESLVMYVNFNTASLRSKLRGWIITPDGNF